MICNAYLTLFCRADVLYIYFLVLFWLKKFAFGYRQNFLYKFWTNMSVLTAEEMVFFTIYFKQKRRMSDLDDVSSS